MARFGPVGVGWTITVVVDQLLGFLTSSLEATPTAASSVAASEQGESILKAASDAIAPQTSGPTATHLVLACVIGLVAGASGGWIAAMIEDDGLITRVLAFLLVFSALVSAGLASMAGYSATGWTWLVGGIMQGVGAFVIGRVKYG